MAILLQDDEGEIASVVGCVCERLICVYVLREDNSTTPSVFWLKIQHGNWHRFFIDSSLFYMRWVEENEISEYELEDEDFPAVDIGTQYGLVGSQIVKAEMRQNADPRGGRLILEFTNGRSLIHIVNQDEQTIELHVES